MAIGRGIRIPIDVDSTGAVAGIRRVDSQLDRLGTHGSASMGRLKSAALGAGAAAGTLLAASLRTGITEVLEQEKASARTANVLETMGTKAGVTQKHIEDLAGKLQELTGTQDDVIQSAANVLLTFDRIGASGGVFDRALAISNDLSVEWGVNMSDAARRVAKALQEPEKGMGPLARKVGALTKEQQHNIDVMLRQGNVMGAQDIILDRLEKGYRGAAQAEGEHTEQIQHMQRAWEEASESFTNKLAPVISGILDFGQAWDRTSARVRSSITEAMVASFNSVRRNVNRIVEFFRNLPGRVGDALASLGGKITGAISTAAGDARTAAREIGIGIADGILQGFKDAWHRVTDWLSSAVHGVGSFVSNLNPLHFASGGAVPGKHGMAIPIVAHAGEVVLNPEQQRRVGRRRIMSVLRGTGGKTGDAGDAGIPSPQFRQGIASFANGGVVSLADAKRVGQDAADHAFYSQGGYDSRDAPGSSRVGPASYDCSGLAGVVAAKIPGYTGGIGGTVGTYWGQVGNNRTADPHKDPVTWGFIGTHHMFVTVDGTAYNAHSWSMGVDNSYSPGAVFRIPPGLGYLSKPGTVGEPDAGDPGRGARTRSAQGSAPKKPKLLTPAQALKATRAIIKGGLGSGSPSSASDVAGASIESRHRDDSLQDKQARAAGEAGAREGGITNPDKLAAAGDLAVLQTRQREIGQDAADVKKAADKVRAKIAKLRKDLKGPGGLYEQLGKTRNPEKRRALIDKINAKREAIREQIDELKALIKQGADIQAEADEINYDVGQLVGQIAQMPNVTPPDPGSDPGISADASAQIAQSDERARVAARGQAISDTFIRTLFGSGSIDPASGATQVNINVNGSLVRQEEVGRWIVGVLGGQGSVPTSSFGMGL